MKPFKVTATKFIGGKENSFTYEITFNQSLVHTGRFTGIENGLNKYREDELKEEEESIERAEIMSEDLNND